MPLSSGMEEDHQDIMPVSPEELVRLLALLATEENLKVTVKETLKGGAMAGAGAVIGGFCGGPIGIAVGGAVGGMAGAYMTQGKFQSVPEILKAMDSERRRQLYDYFRNILAGFDAYDVVTLSALVTGDEVVRIQALNGLRGFFGTVMNMEIADGN
ncbi:protein C19orf12 homolog isoform X2 [Acanthaster planci]|uniref:Protein C19orf12 homolog isoform X2 n=1 Tax=Acanthaster planci TaxID=133434 RepID=A0A8B7YKT8_ACAPL|nr:protein C19orf12 homolog isoform X2 [Acanthaster planci]